MLLVVGGVVGVGGGHAEVAAGVRGTGVQALAVEEGALAAYRGGQLVAGRGVGPGGEQFAVLDQGDQGAEAGVAVHELAGAVDGVDYPDRRGALERAVGRGVGVHRLLADHDGAGQQRAERPGEVLLGPSVGVGHQVVGAALLVDLVRGEPAPARHDFQSSGLADGFLHVGGAPSEKLVDGFRVYDHVPHKNMRH